ncbi:MAG TPA: ABC transporter substrate-binding protein, partial [Longimicrobium sp.]
MIAAVGNWKGDEEVTLRQGIELGAAEINRGGGIGGRTLRIDFRDDGNDPPRAAATARALVADEGVMAVIGHTRSEPTVVASKVYHGEVPVVLARVSSPDVVGLSRWVFQLMPSETAFGAAAAGYAADHGFRRAAVVFNNSARGRETAGEFRRQFRGEVVSMDPLLFPTAPLEDMRTYVEYHRRQAPDVVFAPFGEPRHADYIRE